MSENHFECFARTGVNTPGTMSPISSFSTALRCNLFIPGPPAMFPIYVPKVMKPGLSTAKGISEDVLNVLGIHFSGLVVESFAMGVQNQDVRDVALVVLLDQFLLLG